MFDNNNKKQIRELEKSIAENQQLYRRVFDTVDGKMVLEDLAKRCFENYTSFDANNPYQTSFNEGRRSVYKHIINLLNRDLKELLEELTKE